MYSTCLHCHKPLGRNDAVEHFPVGRRLAFDSAKGRLWVVCQHCARWNLTPIEERWEAVEESERTFCAHRLRAQTDNIGLVRLRDSTELIRIGRPLRPEFAAWRYGESFRRRYRKEIAITAAGAAVAGLVGALGAGALDAMGAFLLQCSAANFAMSIWTIRRGKAFPRLIGDNGKPLQANLEHTRFTVLPGESIHLHLRHAYGRVDLVGDRAARALATLLTFVNRTGGSAGAVKDASTFIADAGDSAKAMALIGADAERRTGDFEERAAQVARGPRGKTIGEVFASQRDSRRDVGFWAPNGIPPRNRGALNRLPRVQRLALEMSLHEESEQHALEGELETLRRDWQEAEEIAAIADGMLTQMPGPAHAERERQ
jgi:hypothetical protein